MTRFILLVAVASVLFTITWAEVDVITEPRPGQEYVFVHTSGNGARPVARKEKATDASGRPFETAHKVPTVLTFRKDDIDQETDVVKKTIIKRAAAAAEVIPAPPGSIKIDPKKLIEKYKSVLTTSTTKRPSTSRPSTTTKRSRRTKKEAPTATTANSVLTTGAPPTPRTLHIHDGQTDAKLAASSSENKRSRIQVKKGPNGQDYEYEYVYYYYDDDEDEGKEKKEKITNSHDGPQRNSVSNGRGKYNSIERTSTTQPEPATNEVVPVSRGGGRGRGRQLNHEQPEDKVAEERLPANTRFPPRSRNLNTTPSTPEEDNETTTKKQRGRPQATDNTPDESQVSGRGRNRSSVRRPSLELVDSASFNTHSSSDPAVGPYKEPKARGEQANVSSGPSFPSELPEGPVRFLGATPNEKMDLQDLKSRLAEDEVSSTAAPAESVSTVTTEETGTTEISGMGRVAHDLYAIVQGTQKLSGEEKDENNTDETDSTTTEDASTDVTTTEVVTTEEVTTPTTTTTTTTTTTPAPTTTSTTPEPTTGRRGFRRPGPGGSRFKSSPSTTTSAPSESSTEKAKGRFSRPGFGGRARPGARTTTEASEPEATKEDSKPVSNSRPSIGGRRGFGGRGRTPASTTTAPETSDSSTASSAVHRPGLTRPRPGFNLRRRGPSSTTAEPEEGASPAEESHNEEAHSSTTAKSIRGRVNGNLARPLRPGPRINLATRGRPGAGTSTTAPPEVAVDGEETPAEESHVEGEDKTAETTPQPAANPLHKLRNRPKINVQPASRPKTAATAQVQVRRTNPLLARRKPVVNAEPSEAPTEAAQETATDAAEESEAPSEAPSSTTEEPRGLNKLLAGRRRLVGRPAAAANH